LARNPIGERNVINLVTVRKFIRTLKQDRDNLLDPHWTPHHNTILDDFEERSARAGVSAQESLDAQIAAALIAGWDPNRVMEDFFLLAGAHLFGFEPSEEGGWKHRDEG
jgi:hypothetical protein